MVCIDIDGIWCKKCNKLHPTLMWHDKYNNYLLDRREQWQEAIDKHFKNIVKDAEYIDNLPYKNLEEKNIEGECVICKSKTFFTILNTNTYVCSDECKYGYMDLDNGK